MTHETEETRNLPDMLKKALNVIAEGIFYVDKRGILVYANSAADIICTDGACRAGEPFFAQCPKAISTKTHPLFHELAAYPERRMAAMVEIDCFHFEIDCLAVLDERDEFTGMVGVVRDISEHRKYATIMRRISSMDSVTRLYNRRKFHIKLKEESLRSKRQNRPLSLIIFDIDNFKEVNDRLGHLKGDNVLRRIGEIITHNTRENVDVPCRYGGDEFAILIPDANVEQAADVARRIRDEVSREVDLPVTVSGGVAELGEDNPEELLNIADTAMSRAKSMGGDLVFVQEQKQEV